MEGVVSPIYLIIYLIIPSLKKLLTWNWIDAWSSNFYRNFRRIFSVRSRFSINIQAFRFLNLFYGKQIAGLLHQMCSIFHWTTLTCCVYQTSTKSTHCDNNCSWLHVSYPAKSPKSPIFQKHLSIHYGSLKRLNQGQILNSL